MKVEQKRNSVRPCNFSHEFILQSIMKYPFGPDLQIPTFGQDWWNNSLFVFRVANLPNMERSLWPMGIDFWCDQKRFKIKDQLRRWLYTNKSASASIIVRIRSRTHELRPLRILAVRDDVTYSWDHPRALNMRIYADLEYTDVMWFTIMRLKTFSENYHSHFFTTFQYL